MLIAFTFLIGATKLEAYDPDVVDGLVNIEVKTEGEKWQVIVTNMSKQDLTYEMMGEVPRGLGVELWEGQSAIKLHAGDLAEWLDTDGFPADLREIKAGKSVTFQFNPKAMSATDDEFLKSWKTSLRSGYYDFRVFFGVYASRLMSISPKKKPANKAE